MRPSITRTCAPNILRHSAAVLAGFLAAFVGAGGDQRHAEAAAQARRDGMGGDAHRDGGAPAGEQGRAGAAAGTTQVTGPGQLRCIRARSAGLKGRYERLQALEMVGDQQQALGGAAAL
jgi:hypothetical protein